MSHTLTIQNLGPVRHCVINIADFTVLAGPQSNGKSTIAKAVYYFCSVKQDILQLMLQGGPRQATGNPHAKWNATVKQRMREKFLQLFGTSWAMSPDMTLHYVYQDDVECAVFLKDCRNNTEASNYIDFSFSSRITDYLNDLDQRIFDNMLPEDRAHHTAELNDLFDDPYETVFIPAGRNLITLLSAQLNYIFSSLEPSQLRNIDYSMRKYIELILKLKPTFQRSIPDIWDEFRQNPEKTAQKKKLSPIIRLLLDDAAQVLHGNYRYVDGEERLYLDNRKFVKIGLASSGQQEAVWIFNLLFYFLLEELPVFLILEEPESHLFPESQRILSETLALFANCKNLLLVTTHSPYVLGTFNYLLLAAQAKRPGRSFKAVHKRKMLCPDTTAAYYVCNGQVVSMVSDADGIKLICNERIDGASEQINRISDQMLELLTAEENE